MAEEKSKVRMAIDNLVNDAVMFLKGEHADGESSLPPPYVPLYTKEEKKQLMTDRGMKRFPKRSSE